MGLGLGLGLARLATSHPRPRAGTYGLYLPYISLHLPVSPLYLPTGRLLLRAHVRRLLHLRVQQALPQALAVRPLPHGPACRPRLHPITPLAREDTRARARCLPLLEPLGRCGPPLAVHSRRGRLLRARGAPPRDAASALGSHAAPPQWILRVPPMARQAVGDAYVWLAALLRPVQGPGAPVVA